MRTIVQLVRMSVLVCSFTLIYSPSHSQSISFGDGKFELGLGIGPMHFLGDLGGSAGEGRPFIKDLDIPLTNLSKGLYFNYYPTEWLGLRLAVNHGYVRGDDNEAPAKGGAEEDRKYRNLNFRSPISEAYGAIEIYPTFFFEKYDGLQGKLRPYVLAGGGVFKFNPEVRDDDGSWVKTAPLRLEGQGFPQYPDVKPYKLTQFSVMGGAGVKYYLKENMYIGFEVLHRKLFTDYIDDVSQNYYIDPIYFDQNLPAADAIKARRLYYRGVYTFPTTRPYQEFAERGDPTENDAFFSTILRMGWRLGGNAATKHLKCPVFY